MNTKKVYQLWRQVPAWSNERESENCLFLEHYKLSEISHFYSKLVSCGVYCWIQINEENRL